LAAESALVAAKVPSLQIRSIQTRRVARLRWTARLIFSSSRALQILLAAVLLGLPARRRMSIQKYHSSPTSNDLLESRIAENTSTLHGPVGAQSAEDVPNIDDVPAVSTET
jgi:hypothetical protein